MPQLFLAGTGAQRDPKNAMQWLGTSHVHLFALDHADPDQQPQLKRIVTAPVGCNAMSAAQLPKAEKTAAVSSFVFTDMADVHKTGAGGLTLFDVSIEGVTIGQGEHNRANTGGRSPCAVAVCPIGLSLTNEEEEAGTTIQLAAVACYEGRGDNGDGVVSLIGIRRQAGTGQYSFWHPSSTTLEPETETETEIEIEEVEKQPLYVVSHDAASEIGGGATPGDGRQDAAHPHGVTWWCPPRIASPASEEDQPVIILLVADLGANKVVAYAVHRQPSVDGKSGSVSMTLAGFFQLQDGAGPRHMVLLQHPTNPNRATIVVVNELDNTVVPISASITSGESGTVNVGFEGQNVLSTLPPGFEGQPPFPFYTAPSHAYVSLLPIGPHQHRLRIVIF